MKILFINKYDTTGGAAIAAQRIANGLAHFYQTENHFLVGIKKSRNNNVTPTRKYSWQSKAEQGWNFLSSRLGLQYLYFPFSTPAILHAAKEFQPDVISLHNIHGGYFETALLPVLSAQAPLVWTLHDMWAFTANAAHTFGDESWKQLRAGKAERKSFPAIGLPTGSWLLRRKQKIYSQSELHIVSPARWLYDLAVQSPALAGKPVHHIPNPLDTRLYTAKDKIAAKTALQLQADLPVISFVAEKLFSSEHKGGREMLGILQQLDRQLSDPVQLLLIGHDRLPVVFNHLRCHYTGYIHEETQMIACYNASDVFFYPTRADTLPNTLLEAAACGVPCVSFDIGGCREILLDQQSGYLIPAFDQEQFVHKTLQLLQNEKLRQEMGRQAMLHVQNEFGAEKVAAQYFHLFSTVKR